MIPIGVFAQDSGAERTINPMKLPFLREASSGDSMNSPNGGVGTGGTGTSTGTDNGSGSGTGQNVQVEPGGLISQANSCRFRDIAGNSSAEAINYLYNKGIAGGRRPCYFDPNAVATRAEVTTMVVRAVDVTVPASPEPKAFPDTDLRSWSARHVKAAKNADIVHGYPDGLFRAEKPANVVETLKITTRGFKSDLTISTAEQQQLSRISDIELNQWYVQYVQAGLNEGVIDSAATQIYPASQITRAEVAEMIYILMKRRE
jgi:hypothetical protein